MTPSSLLDRCLERSKAIKRKRDHVSYDQWLPVAVALKKERHTFDEIYDILKAEGEPLPKKPTFRAGMSRVLKKFNHRRAEQVALRRAGK